MGNASDNDADSTSSPGRPSSGQPNIFCGVSGVSNKFLYSHWLVPGEIIEELLELDNCGKMDVVASHLRMRAMTDEFQSLESIKSLSDHHIYGYVGQRCTRPDDVVSECVPTRLERRRT